MPMSEQQRRLNSMANAIATKAQGSGFVCLLRDTEGKGHVIKGHDVELIAVYSEKVRKADVLEDLIDAGVER